MAADLSRLQHRHAAAPRLDRDAEQRERLQHPAEALLAPPRATGDAGDFAEAAGQQREDAIGLAVVDAA
jgi:hypothetical protein